MERLRGPRLRVSARQRAIGKGSGVPVEVVISSVWTIENGQVTRAQNFLDPGEAREAVGLSE